MTDTVLSNGDKRGDRLNSMLCALQEHNTATKTNTEGQLQSSDESRAENRHLAQLRGATEFTGQVFTE